MHGCTKIERTTTHYSRLGVSLVAAAITIIALGAIGYGIMQMNPKTYKFYILRFAIASIAAGSIVTGLALAILCYKTKKQSLVPLTSVTVDQPIPLAAQPTPFIELEINRWGHHVRLPNSLTPYHQMDEMPDNSYYRDEAHTSICAQLLVDGVPTLVFHRFPDITQEPITLLHESLKKPKIIANLLFPKLNERREYSPENYLMTSYCNMQILSPRHIEPTSCEYRDDRIIVQTTLIINGVKQPCAFNLSAITAKEIPVLLQEEINSRSYYCDFTGGVIASQTHAYTLITSDWEECREKRALKDGEYSIQGSTYLFCNTLKSETGHLHHGTVHFTPQEAIDPHSFREEVLLALTQQLSEGKIHISRARHSKYDPHNNHVTT